LFLDVCNRAVGVPSGQVGTALVLQVLACPRVRGTRPSPRLRERSDKNRLESRGTYLKYGQIMTRRNDNRGFHVQYSKGTGILMPLLSHSRNLQYYLNIFRDGNTLDSRLWSPNVAFVMSEIGSFARELIFLDRTWRQFFHTFIYSRPPLAPPSSP